MTLELHLKSSELGYFACKPLQIIGFNGIVHELSEITLGHQLADAGGQVYLEDIVDKLVTGNVKRTTHLLTEFSIRNLKDGLKGGNPK